MLHFALFGHFAFVLLVFVLVFIFCAVSFGGVFLDFCLLLFAHFVLFCLKEREKTELGEYGYREDLGGMGEEKKA